MKIKFFKRIFTLVMCMTMLFVSSNVVMAAENVTDTAANLSLEVMLMEENILPRANTELKAGEIKEIVIGERAAGFSTTATFVTACSKNDGYVRWELLNNGIKVDSGTVGVNDMVYRGFYFSGGNYTMKLSNTASAPVTIFIMDI